MSTIKIGINGLGRIGRTVIREFEKCKLNSSFVLDSSSSFLVCCVCTCIIGGPYHPLGQEVESGIWIHGGAGR